MKVNSKVEKDLSPVEASIIADIKSLLAQLEQAEGAEAPEAPEGGELENGAMAKDVTTDGQPAGDEKQEETEEKKIEKDGATGSDSADARIEDLPKDDENALKIMKSLMAMIGKSQPEAKKVNPVIEALGAVAKSLIMINSRLDQQGDAIVGVLEGIGVADQIVAKSAKPARIVQSNGMDAQAVLQALVSQVQKSGVPAQEAPGNMSDALSMLVGK